jgi:putative FmdB family regulatory protein
MPVYEYQCKACGKEFEYQQRMSDPDKTVCEACGGALERLISRTAFQLKGSGWYKDLYSSAKPESKSAEKGDSGSKESTAEKPAAKSDSASASGSSGSSGTGSGSESSGSGSSTGSGSSSGSGSGTSGSGSSSGVGASVRSGGAS